MVPLEADWHVVAVSAAVPEGGLKAVRLLGRSLVLWRSGGRVRCFLDLCRHRGTQLSLGRVCGERLVCAYHGWEYASSGQCVRIPAHPEQAPPATACLEGFACQERGGLIWVALAAPVSPVVACAEWDDPSYRLIVCGPYEFRAAAPRVVENFLDVGHFAFVHDGLLGDAAHPEIPDYQVSVAADGIMIQDVSVYQPNPDGTGVGAHVTYVYRVFRPFVAWFMKSPGFSITLAVGPESESVSQAFMVMAMNYGHDVPEEELRAFQDRIVAQDRPIVESQRPELLPLDLAAELHLRSDRAAIAYRRWLRELGVGFGTA